MRNDKPNIIVDKTIEFSVRLVKFCEILEEKKKFVIARQLLRSGTAIGANVFEAQNAESKTDFIHKMKIAAKEASESLYWMMICESADSYDFDPVLRGDLDQIMLILSKIIASSKSKAS